MGRKRIDLTNRVYGKLTMLGFKRSGGGGVGAIWTASCECGRILEVIGRDCRAGKRVSCGMCTKSLGIPDARTIRASGVPKGRRKDFRTLVRRAEQLPNGVQFTVTDYLKCSTLRCVGCNVQGVNVELRDPRGPAIPTQLIAMCNRCSSMRRRNNVVKWLEHVNRIAVHQQAMRNQ